MAKVTKKNFVVNIMQYEAGNLSDKETLELFSYLIQSGTLCRLQGDYGRTAKALIDDKWLNSDGSINKAKVKANMIS